MSTSRCWRCFELLGHEPPKDAATYGLARICEKCTEIVLTPKLTRENFPAAIKWPMGWLKNPRNLKG